MKRNRTKNQLPPTPILIPKMRASWMLRGAHTRIQPGVCAGGLLELCEVHLQRAGRARQRPQDVEAHDVARALPDRGQRRLAVQTRHPRVLDVAVAPVALERLARVRGRAL